MDQQAHGGNGAVEPRAAASAERSLRLLLSDPPQGQSLDCPSIFLRLKTHPREAAMVYDHARKMYPLHRFLDLGKTYRIDPGVVRALVDAHREAVFCPNNHGHLPLHFASCIHHANAAAEKIVRMLLNEYSAAARRRSRRGAIPLHFARSYEVARALLEAYPEGIGVQHSNGMLPLHFSVFVSESPRLVGFLCEEGTKQNVGGIDEGGGVFVKDSKGDHPLALVSKLLRRGEASLGHVDDKGRLSSLSKIGTCHWEILETLVQAASLTSQNVGEDCHLSRGKLCVLHALIEFRFDREIIQHAVHMRPKQLQERDRDGKLPLAVALSCRTKSHFVFQNSDEWISDVIDMLLDPDHGFAPAAEMVDRDGRLPLHLAVVSGWKFRDCVDKILKVSPRSLEARDVKTGMYPFMMAAVGPVAYLDMVYELLLANPELARGASHTNRDAADNGADMAGEGIASLAEELTCAI